MCWFSGHSDLHLSHSTQDVWDICVNVVNFTCILLQELFILTFYRYRLLQYGRGVRLINIWTSKYGTSAVIGVFCACLTHVLFGSKFLNLFQVLEGSAWQGGIDFEHSAPIWTERRAEDAAQRVSCWVLNKTTKPKSYCGCFMLPACFIQPALKFLSSDTLAVVWTGSCTCPQPPQSLPLPRSRNNTVPCALGCIFLWWLTQALYKSQSESWCLKWALPMKFDCALFVL
jgi:hypothetical protein